MLKLILISAAVVGFCVLILSFNILRGKEFPETEVSTNKEMRKRGITCAKQDELKLWGKKNKRQAPSCDEQDCNACGMCGGKEETSAKR